MTRNIQTPIARVLVRAGLHALWVVYRIKMLLAGLNFHAGVKKG